MNSWKFPTTAALAVALLAAAGAAHAGVTLNLITEGATGTITTNGVTARYTQVSPQPTGSGYIDPFVRIGMPGGGPGNAIMQAYNTTANVLNNSNDDTFNHEITVGEVGFITSGGNSFMRFILDINQVMATKGRLLNLDDVQIFISRTPNQAVTTFDPGGLLELANSYLVYRQDGAPGGDNLVTLDYGLNHGSGSGDMWLDIPKSAFDAAFGAGGFTGDAAQNGAYVYLYSKFGSAPNENTDGFEEWAHTGAGVPVCTNPNGCGGGGGGGGTPEPASIALLGLGLLGMAVARRRRS